MRVKKFQAKDMADAMRMVKAEMGANAIILHSRDLRRGLMGWFSRGGVEVTAGVDLKQKEAPQNGNGKKRAGQAANKQPRGGRLDVKVADTFEASGKEPPSLLGNPPEENPLLTQSNPQPNPQTQPEKTLPPAYQLEADNPLLALSRKIVEQNTQGKKDDTGPKAGNGDPAPPANEKILEDRLASLESRLIKLTGLIETLAPSIASGETPSVPTHTRELYNHLLEQDVDERLALSLATHIAETTDDEDDVWTTLKAYLVSKIPVAKPIELDFQTGKPKVIMLVGPTGVGKTTTLAKISAQYRCKPGEKIRPKIVFITADLYRLAAVEQLQKYTEILGADLEVTYSPEEVRQALKKHKDAHLILFDTAGTCQRNLPQMSTLASIVDACKPDEVHLVLSSTTKYSDMVDIAEHFKEIKPSRLLFTKIDESTTYGPVLNTVSKFKMPVSYLTTGQNVPEDIEQARPERIAKMLMMKPTVNRMIEDIAVEEKNNQPDKVPNPVPVPKNESVKKDDAKPSSTKTEPKKVKQG